MFKLFTPFFLCSFLLVACAEPLTGSQSLSSKETMVLMKETIDEEFFPSSYRIVSVGDSLTQGIGDSTNTGGYLPYLEQLLEREKSIKEVEFQNFGVSGNRTDQILNRLRTAELKEAIGEADVVLVTTGGNDVMKVVRNHFPGLQLHHFDEELKTYERTLTSVIRTIRSQNQDVIIGLIGIYNPFYQFFTEIEEMNMVTENWNRVSQSVLNKYEHTFFIEIADLFQESEENLLYTDFFHPNDKGYELIANQTFSALQEKVLTILIDKKYIALKEENEGDEE